MTEVQRQIREAIVGPRDGHFGGPYAIWIRVPALAEAANRLGNVLRSDSTLDRATFELLVLVVVRESRSSYAWWAHDFQGRRAGLSQEAIDDVLAGKRPPLSGDLQACIYDVGIELARTQRLSDPTYDRALGTIGIERLVEVVAVVGYYTMIAITLNAFEVASPTGEDPFAVGQTITSIEGA